MNLSLEAQQFLFNTHKGILSTHSVKFTGYPFGSVAPFVLDHAGRPVILISTLAEHTKNIVANPNVSLVVFDKEEDLQANARLTLLAEAKPSDKTDTLLRARYLRYIPQAEQYFDMHDFSFYTLHITHARYIAGFGKMGWVEGINMALAPNALAGDEADIIAHMNSDHNHNLLAYCEHYHQASPKVANMIGIDSLGFDVRADEVILRFDFETPINDAQEARQQLIAMANATRS